MSDSKMVTIPAAFWQGLSQEEGANIILTGQLSPKQTRMLWAILKRKDKPPKGFKLTTISPRKH